MRPASCRLLALAFAALTVTHCTGTSSSTDAAALDATTQRDAQPARDAAAPYSATFTPAAIPASAGDLANPMRGQYRWLGADPYPSGWTANDSYQRWNWVDIEPTRGAINWSLIDNELAAARARHGRFGMRFMPLCQGCANHRYMNAASSIPDDLAAVANPLIGAPPDAPGELYVIPDWNSEAYLSRVEATLQAIAAHYHDDPTFAFVDVSAYGNWGEFHLWPFNQPGGPYEHSTQRPITDDNARRIVRANAAAFANKLIVLNVENRAAVAEAVATQSPRIGLRVDCIGADGLGGGEDPIRAVAGAIDHWRVAPFITEWCQFNIGGSGANLFVQGESQVREFHVSMLSSGNFTDAPATSAEIDAFHTANTEAGYRLRTPTVAIHFDPAHRDTLDVESEWTNEGVAPTYLTWRVIFGLRSAAGSVERPLAVDLREVVPDAPTRATDHLVVPAAAAGSYVAYLRVEDAQSISPPMALAMDGRNDAGEYTLGTLVIE